MDKKFLTLETTKIAPCESITIKDPYYENDIWCAFHTDACFNFTHAKCAVSNYIDHYTDEQFDFDMNTTEFAFIIGMKNVLNCFTVKTEENGKLGVYSSLNEKLVKIEKTEIGCDTAEFSFGTEKTFGEFAIRTGSDGFIGEVHLYKYKPSGNPVGLLFIGSLDGDIVSPELVYDSFIAAFGIERTKDKSFEDKIADAQNRKGENKNNRSSKEIVDDFEK